MSRPTLDKLLQTPPPKQSTPDPATEKQPQHTQYQKTPYEGQCYGEPCFYLPDGYTFGKCLKTSQYIELSLAKKQRMCDHENTAYHRALKEKPRQPPHSRRKTQ